MKFVNYLNEKYIDLFKNWSGGVEVYENPTYDDLKDMVKSRFSRDLEDLELRFTAVNSEKKLFIWNGENCNHEDMYVYLVQRNHIKPGERAALNQDLFNGYARIKNKRLVMGDSDDFAFFTVNKLSKRLSHDWSWLKKYFSDIHTLTNLQDKLKNLGEDYVGTYDYQGKSFGGFLKGPVEVFVNPTMKEIKSAADAPGLTGHIRFMIDYKTKNLFVWKGGMFHINVFAFLQEQKMITGPAHERLMRDMIWGVARLYNGKLDFEGSDTFTTEGLFKSQLYKRYKDKEGWTSKWFGKPFLDTFINDLDLE